LVIDESTQESTANAPISVLQQVPSAKNVQDEEMTVGEVLSPIGLPDVRPSTSAYARGEVTDDGDVLSQVGDVETQPSTSAASVNTYRGF
jgi:hypothetical protein